MILCVCIKIIAVSVIALVVLDSNGRGARFARVVIAPTRAARAVLFCSIPDVAFRHLQVPPLIDLSGSATRGQPDLL